ncbi:hypothetical protein GCM10011609_06630 [Lentzea pudingi]|uniref:Metalloprotease TldD/E C-terminal domain-containing protein n=2 Tax=Lentzea pudingi TaxID=1789439 RepID=A0ABQ2HBP3_9PSEU|nr:hypothetical protein GCM10011609_06630 [Lentzea pudingi]
MICYAGRTRRLRVRVLPDGTVERHDDVRVGACTEITGADGVREHRVSPLFEDRVRDLRPAELDTAELVELARAQEVTLTAALFHQHVLAGPPEVLRFDERHVASLTISTEGGWDVVGWRDPAPLAVPGAVEALRRRNSLPFADLPPEADLVLAPGRAGSFFHELLGHPMEADVLASGTSWLSRRAGDRVAPAWLTVIDGLADPAGGYHAVVDDEGTPTTAVPLLDAGVVGSPMTDRSAAAALGLPATGHGRRLDHRHPAVVRMAHTRAQFPLDTPVTPSRHAEIRPFGLALVRMNVATGEFVFRAGTALLQGEHRLRPFEIHGRADEVLAALEPVDPEVRAYGRADRGCGKLGQFPLPVSFANAGVRLPAGSVVLR